MQKYIEDKNWAFLFICGVCFSFFSIIGFNYFVDAFGWFHKKHIIKDMAQTVLSGKSIAVRFEDYQDREYQKNIVLYSTRKVDAIACGASTIFQLNHQAFSHQYENFINHGTSFGTLHDCISNVGLYAKQKHYIPKTIFMAIDPYIFNPNLKEKRWETLKEYYDFIMQKITELDKTPNKEAPSSNEGNKWLNLINSTYTKANFNFFLSGLASGSWEHYFITESVDNVFWVRNSDNSYTSPLKFRSPEIQSVEFSAKNFGGKNSIPWFFNGFSRVENTLFERFVYYLKSENIEIKFYLPPYHPISYDLIINNPDYKIVEGVEKYIRQFASKNKIQLLGSYNPKLAGVSGKDFYDGLHLINSSLQNIFLKNQQLP
jgi:hypothetical protein